MKPKTVNLVLTKGVKVRTPFELAKSFRSMPKEIFKKHVSTTKNRFASWLKAIGDNDLAKVVSKYKSKDPMEKAILKELIARMKRGAYHVR